jgi:hypothetical protein
VLNRFRLYSVHLNPAAARPYETAEFVPEGFNLWAFLFGPLWALYQRLWALAFLLFCLNGILSVLMQHFGFSTMSGYVLQMGIQLMVGFQANDARRAILARRGYIVADVVAAHTLLHAEQRFYDRYLPTLHDSGARSVTLAEA